MAQQQRAGELIEGDGGGGGVAGEDGHGGGAEPGHGHRLAGFEGHAVHEEGGAQPGEDVLHPVLVAHRGAAAGEEHVDGGGEPGEDGAQLGVVIPGALEGHDFGAGLAAEGGEEDEVALVDLVGEGGLAESRTPWVLAVACDMPFVEEGAVRRLLQERGEEVDAVCFTVGGRVEPLLGVYRRELEEPWGEVLKKEEPSLRSLLSRCRGKLLPEEALREVDAELRSVVSVNTPEDLERHGVRRPCRSSLPLGEG